MSSSETYPLRLPKSIKAAAGDLARSKSISLNQFVATAVAEKLSAMRTASFFAEARERADLDAFRRILSRPGGEIPRECDEMPG